MEDCAGDSAGAQSAGDAGNALYCGEGCDIGDVGTRGEGVVLS